MIVWGFCRLQAAEPCDAFEGSLAEFRLSQKPEKSEIYFLTGSAGQKILLSPSVPACWRGSGCIPQKLGAQRSGSQLSIRKKPNAKAFGFLQCIKEERKKREKRKRYVLFGSCYNDSIAQGGSGKVDNLLTLSEQIMNIKTSI